MLELQNADVFYAKAQALHHVDFAIAAGGIAALIGRNGAGKSTLLRALAGGQAVASGARRLDGADITRLAAHECSRLGIALVPENRQIFPSLTAEENLRLPAAIHPPGYWTLERVYGLFPRLAERRATNGTSLSGGEQQMLAIGRALMSRPRLLLLDEPSLGLAPLIVRQIFESIGRIAREEGVTIFLVEQNAFHALTLADRGYVLANGRVRLSGSGKDLLANQEVRAAYLEGGHG